MPMLSSARACLRLRSTPQSVEPATSLASGCSGQQVEGLGQGCRADVVAVRPVMVAGTGAGRGRGGAGGERVGRLRVLQRVRRVPDRPVAGAAAQVAAQGVQIEAVRAVLVVGRRRLRGRARSPRPRRSRSAPGGRTRPPSSRRNRGCSSRTANRRGPPSPAAPDAAPAGVPRPSAVTTSWPSSAAAGTRQALIAVQVLRSPSASGLSTTTAQAPHSPSAQPSLVPVRPPPRSQSSRVTSPPTSPRAAELTVDTHAGHRHHAPIHDTPEAPLAGAVLRHGERVHGSNGWS